MDLHVHQSSSVCDIPAGIPGDVPLVLTHLCRSPRYRALMRALHKLPLSSNHLEAAVVFATQARDFELKRAKPQILNPLSEHRAACMGCVLSAVGYLEANINEFFSDAAEEGVSDGVAATAVNLERLRRMWYSHTPKTNILDKYDLVLTLCDLPFFDKGAAPYQGAALLIRLRNTLTHFVPEWQPTAERPMRTGSSQP